ncbi:MAG: hypothetical protein AAF828_01570 [Bacteroidota bacterium]
MVSIIPLYHRSLPKPTTLRTSFNSDGKLGVENVKIVLTIVVTFLVDLILSLRDRNYTRIITTLFNLLRYGNIIDLAKLAWQEFKDIDELESQELSDHFAETLDLPNDETEALIEYAVQLVPTYYGIIADGIDVANRAIDTFQEARRRFSGVDPEDDLAGSGSAIEIAERAKVDRLAAA